MKAAAAIIRLIQSLTPIHGEAEARSVARIIAEDVLNIYSLNAQKELSDEKTQQFEYVFDSLLNGIPLQYILEKADFFGIKFYVRPDVLIPRAETEELVRIILENHPKELGLRLLDIGTGSGCIPISIAKHRPHWRVQAMDVSPAALEVAHINARQNEVNIDFFESDILDKKSWDTIGHLDIIVSNPPYIPLTEKTLMPPHVLDHEPHLALFVQHEDALIFYKKINELALKNLNSNGRLYFECNEFNAKQLSKYLKEYWQEVILLQDMSGKDRMLICGTPIE